MQTRSRQKTYVAIEIEVATEVDVVTQSVLKEEKGSGRDPGLCYNRNFCHDRMIGSRHPINDMKHLRS